MTRRQRKALHRGARLFAQAAAMFALASRFTEMAELTTRATTVVARAVAHLAIAMPARGRFHGHPRRRPSMKGK